MHRLRILIAVIPAVVLFMIFAIFVVENIRIERYSFLGGTFAGNVAWVVLISALLGFVLGALLFVPGRISAEWRTSRLSRQADLHTHDWATARVQEAQHLVHLRHLRQIVAGRGQRRSHLTGSATAEKSTIAPPVPHI
jgi:uncharacterized integral membrane protein